MSSKYNIELHIDNEPELFTFGNCAPQLSERLWYLPAMVYTASLIYTASCLAGYFPSLFSLERQGSLGINSDTEYKTCDLRQLGLCSIPTTRSSAGHLAIDIPEN